MAHKKNVVYKMIAVITLFIVSFMFEKAYGWRTWFRNSRPHWVLLEFNDENGLCGQYFIPPAEGGPESEAGPVKGIDSGIPPSTCNTPLTRIDVFPFDGNNKKTLVDTIPRSEMLFNSEFIL